MDDVGVGEEEPPAPGRAHALPARPRLAHPAGRERLAVDHPHPGVALGRRARRGGRAVARLVVHHEHLERRVLEGAEAPHRRADAPLLVPGGEDDAHQGALAQGRLRLGAVGHPPLVQREGDRARPDRPRDLGRQR